MTTPETQMDYAELAKLREENARLSAELAQWKQAAEVSANGMEHVMGLAAEYRAELARRDAVMLARSGPVVTAAKGGTK